MFRLDKIGAQLGRKFRNYIFRNRLGGSVLSARIIFFLMGLFDRFEVYSNTKEVGRFDHYVPQFLLKNFKIGITGEIYYCEVESGFIDKDGISNVAGEIDYDVGKSKGEPSDFVNKKIFGELLEQKTSWIIKRLNENTVPDLTYLEESTLVVFIAHQITRVPAFRELLLHFFSVGFSESLIKFDDFGNKNALRDEVVLNKIGISYAQLMGTIPKIGIGGGKPQLILVSLQIATEIAEKIYKKGNLHILEVPVGSSDEFVISDNPVVFLDFKRMKILEIVPWWEIGTKDFWIFIPISPKKGIFYTHQKKKDGPVENNNNDLVQLFNFGQYLNSSKKVFAQNKKTLESHIKLFESELRRQGKII